MRAMRPRASISLIAAAVLAVPFAVGAQDAIQRAPTAADWAALAKLPDFSGVWEAGGGGGGGRGAGRGGAPAGPQLTPAADAKRKELLSKAAEDSQTANC